MPKAPIGRRCLNEEAASSARLVISSGKALSSCHLTVKHLSIQQVEDIWKNSALRQLSILLGVPNVSKFVDASLIHGIIINLIIKL